MSGSKADAAPLAGRDEDEVLVHFILNQLDKDSAEDIVSIDLQGKSAMADHMVIASGRSTRQVSAITEKLTDILKSERGVLCRTEGKDAGDWVLIDAGDVIVHLFRPEVREFYQLEKMWSPTPETGRMTVGSA
ncbi:MAG: ribosome silencing factor [Paracoccaceae bacterium]|nr:ribosome silencing factor [Paracoccaceae bacterium]